MGYGSGTTVKRARRLFQCYCMGFFFAGGTDEIPQYARSDTRNPDDNTRLALKPKTRKFT